MGPSLKDPPQAEGPPGETVGQTLRQRPKARTWNAPQPHTAAKSAPSDRPRRPAPKKYAKGDPLGSPFFANAAGERIAPPTHCPAPLQEANRVEGPYGQYGIRDERSQNFPSTPIIYTPFAPLYTPNALRRQQITKNAPSNATSSGTSLANPRGEKRRFAQGQAPWAGSSPPEIPRPPGTTRVQGLRRRERLFKSTRATPAGATINTTKSRACTVRKVTSGGSAPLSTPPEGPGPLRRWPGEGVFLRSTARKSEATRDL